jgi:hypothetical protein
MKPLGAFTGFLLGQPITLPAVLLARYPELAAARWRRGGLALRIGGWCLGQGTVAAITLWDTVFLHRRAALDPALLLHEVRHVHHFQGDRTFPLRYLWGTLRHGYLDNPYEADARAFATRRLAGATSTV